MPDNLITISENNYISLKEELQTLQEKVVSLENELESKTETYSKLLNGIAIATNCFLSKEDYHQSINSALAALGEAVSVDRIYVFENHQHPETKEMLMSQRWEWVNHHVTPQIDNPLLQNIPYKDCYTRWYECFLRKEAICGLVKDFPQTEKEMLAAQSILSVCIMPIYIQEKLWGFIGFDDCHTERKWSDMEKAALKAAVGNFGAAISRKLTETKLYESRQFMQLVIDNIPQLIVWKDRNSVFKGCNIAVAKAVGLNSTEEIVGKNDYDMPTTKEESDWYRECDRKVMNSGEPELHIIETQTRPDGKQAWLDTSKIPLRDSNNKVIGILVTIENITEQKLFEERLANLNRELEQKVAQRTEQLHQTEARLQRLADNIPGIFYECHVDNDGKVTYPFVSSGCREILGIEPQEIQEDAGKLLQCIHPDDIPRMREANAISRKNLSNWKCEWRIVTPEGEERWVKAIARPQQQENGGFTWYSCMMDITERKAAQHTLEKRANRIRVQNKVLTRLARNPNTNKGGLEKLSRMIAVNTAKTLNVERVSLWMYDESKTYLECINLFELSKNKHTQEIRLCTQDYPAYFKAIEKEDIIVANNAREDAKTCEFSDSYLTPLGISSTLDATIRSRGNTLGVICVEHIGETRNWTPEDENFIRSVANIMSLAIEVRESKHAEDLLSEKEQFLRSIYDGVNYTIFTLDILKEYQEYKFKCRGLNSFGLKTIGKESSEIVGKTLEEIFGDITARRIRQKCVICIGTNQAIAYEERLQLQGENKHLLTALHPIKDRNGNTYRLIGTTLDISDRKRAEIALQQKATELEKTLLKLQHTQAQLIQSEKMSGLGQMVAGIAHEINNPASFIHGNLKYAQEYVEDLFALLELYQKHYPLPSAEIQNFMEEIELDFLKEDLDRILISMDKGTCRIRDIVLNLRNFSRLDESDFKRVDIHEGIESTLMILQSRLKLASNYPEIQVIKNYAHLPLIECYPGQLNQVFMNILTNAIDAIKAEPSKNWTSCPQISISTKILDKKFENDTIQISIADSGCGISEEITQKIFNPFFTTKDVGKGTGLGLSISYQIIVDKHNGKLYCQSSNNKSNNNKQTEFIIEIPVYFSAK